MPGIACLFRLAVIGPFLLRRRLAAALVLKWAEKEIDGA
jgi:hypothetical protein